MSSSSVEKGNATWQAPLARPGDGDYKDAMNEVQDNLIQIAAGGEARDAQYKHVRIRP